MGYPGSAFAYVQVGLAIIIGVYFWNLLRNQQCAKTSVAKESRKETESLRRLRDISLTEPLSERTRPTSFTEIVGQEEGLKALRAALCGPNPQHVLVYGPPGVGKTAAARLVLEEAKSHAISPFQESAKFVEIDATTARFDERGIADPLIGSVHDPIYQGAGPLGMAGVPQPKPGAVTKAHGGVLFIDEIGELHPIQMNKLLKVLEDRKVFLESAYYNPEDANVPSHIKDIFDNGLPADFRMIGATTRMPEDIPAAIRSRCLEIFFKPLRPYQVGAIAQNAANKIGVRMGDNARGVIEKFASNGREAVNIVQVAAGVATGENRNEIRQEDVEWVVSSGQYPPRAERHVPAEPQIGCANGLAVLGPNMGIMVEVEVATYPVDGEGRITVTGIIEEEELGSYGHRMKRKSLVRGSVENVLTVLRRYLDVDPWRYDIHINFPGGIPIDGPSAGVTVATAIYSSITDTPISNLVCMTGEVSIRGLVRPVGGITAKVEAAKEAGATKVIIPKDNWQEIFRDGDIEVISVENMDEVLREALVSAAVVAAG